MPEIQVLPSLPGSPDSLLSGSPSPPKTLLISACPALRVTLHVSAGTVAARPYYHVGGDGAAGRWVGLGQDTAVPYPPLTASGANTSDGVFPAYGEPRWWILLAESGGGTADAASIDAAESSGERESSLGGGGGGPAAPVLETAGTTGTPTKLPLTGASQPVWASRAARVGGTLKNDSSNIVYVKYGASASADDYNFDLQPGDRWTMDRRYYSGALSVFSAAGTGYLRHGEVY